MMRWLEEFELTHVDFMRCLKSFHKMHEIWLSLASGFPSSHSAAAFARRQSHIYLDLHKQALTWFTGSADPRFLHITEENIIEVIQEFRKTELGWLESYRSRPSD